ncbi:MAG TPA: M28 family peptidase [Planctomycetota bacterium]|nr:M28 family peptidase [Planctomycetota bacterium]
MEGGRRGAMLLGLCAGIALQPFCGAVKGPEFDQARAWRHLEALVAIGPRPAGSEGAEATRVYIERELRAAGLEPRRESFTAQTPIGPVEMANVYADIEGAPGAGQPAPMIVLCTHYETKRMPFRFVGANDSGSGTAVLLELARVLAPRSSGRFAYRILFLDGEEAMRAHWEDPDNRYGSRHHVQELKKSGTIARVKACVLLDLVGDKDLRLMRDEYSNQQFLNAFFEAAREIGLGQHVGGRSEPIKDDHLSFLEGGIESVDLIDFDYGPGNSYWHTAEDTLDKCSAESLGATGRIVLHGLPKLERLLR